MSLKDDLNKVGEELNATLAKNQATYSEFEAALLKEQADLQAKNEKLAQEKIAELQKLDAEANELANKKTEELIEAADKVLEKEHEKEKSELNDKINPKTPSRGNSEEAKEKKL